MNLTPETIIAGLTALGIGSMLTTIATALLGRNKTRADVTAVLSEASSKLVVSYEKANAGLSKELHDAKAEVAALRAEVAGLEGKLDQVLDVVTEEKRWATANKHTDAPVLKLVHTK